MSRLTDLIEQVEKTDSQLAELLRAEYGALNERRAYGLNFERHTPETVDLPGCPIRRRDKVRFLPERDADAEALRQLDKNVWVVTGFKGTDSDRFALLIRPSGTQPGETIQCERRVADLVVVAEFRDPIYPGLKTTGKVERGGTKPWHAVINAENYHALEALLYTHEGKVDAIYIDPPYNSGARDWKYNNDYVEADDLYRHSKWLAFMERRLKLAKRLLDPIDSVLIVTIDEKEYLRLGLLLQQVFPESVVQMVTSVVNRKGVPRGKEFSRVDEFLFFVFIGSGGPGATSTDMLLDASAEVSKMEWVGFRRRGSEWRRTDRPGSFYPVYVDPVTGKIDSFGPSLKLDESRHDIPDRPGLRTVWPLNSRGDESRWQLSGSRLMELLDGGYVRSYIQRGGGVTIEYLSEGQQKQVMSGELVTTGRDANGALVVAHSGPKMQAPKTVWNRDSHGATAYGTQLLTALIPGHRFPFPKSLYAVEDTLRFFVSGKPEAVVVDFFAGSGTTAHAVMRLNKQDGGRRQSISVTNNEVSADEQKRLTELGLRPGDPEWEQWGICDYITKPRIAAAITGETPDGTRIRGEYKFTDEFAISDGLDENVEFFTMTCESPKTVAYNRSFRAVAPLLWLKAGARGSRIDEAQEDYALAESYGILFDLDHSGEFANAVRANEHIRTVFVVADDEWLFTSVCTDLPEHVTKVRLYSSYLESFALNAESRD